MCANCERHKAEKGRGNRSGRDELGQAVELAAKKEIGLSLEEVLKEMAEGSENIGRVKPLQSQ